MSKQKKSKKKFKCEFCEKEFTTKQNRDKHQSQYCLSNSASTKSIKIREGEENEKEIKVNVDDDIQFLKEYYKGRNEGNVYMKKEIAIKLFDIFKRKINNKIQLKITCHLNRRYVYTVLFRYIKQIEKNEK